MVVVIALRTDNGTPQALIGHSAGYLLEKDRVALIDPNDQRVAGVKDVDNVYEELVSRIPDLIKKTGISKIKVSRESIRWNNNGNYSSGKFISNQRLFPPGFIKGGNKGGESDIAAAKREFQEETGTDYPESKFTQLGTGCVLLSLTKDEGDDVVANWKKMDDANRGEVFNLRWEPVDAVRALIASNTPNKYDKFNEESTKAANSFLDQAVSQLCGGGGGGGCSIGPSARMASQQGRPARGMPNTTLGGPKKPTRGGRRRSTRRRRALRKTRKAYI